MAEKDLKLDISYADPPGTDPGEVDFRDADTDPNIVVGDTIGETEWHTDFPLSGDVMIEWEGRRVVFPEQMRECVVPVLMGTEYDIPVLPDEPIVRTVLDIGGGCGAFALWAMKRWPGCEVIIVEPDVDMRRYIERNVPEASIVRGAVVGGNERLVGLNIGPDGHRGYNSVVPRMTGYPWHSHIEIVPAIPASRLPRADVIKIDAEGVERDILGEYRYLDMAWWVTFEWHNEYLRQPCERIMANAGFTMVTGRTQDRDLGVETWCRTKARMRRRGPWEWRMPERMMAGEMAKYGVVDEGEDEQ